jgi:predicted nuclease with TOPRIM domain
MKNESEANAPLLETGDLQDVHRRLEARARELMELSEKYREVSGKLARLRPEHEELSGRLRAWPGAPSRADAEIDRLRVERRELIEQKSNFPVWSRIGPGK